MDLFVVLICIAIVLFFINLFLQWNYNYWKQRGVPYEEPSKLGLGNLKDALLFRKTVHHLNDEIYKKFSDCKYVGYFNLREPAVFVRDVDLISNIVIKDFAHFYANDVGWTEKSDKYLGKNPFVLSGERWKIVRNQITPALSSLRMKNVFPQMIQNSKLLIKHIESDLNNSKDKGVLVKEICLRYTINSVASAILNLNVKSFENPNSEFHRMGRKAFDFQSLRLSLKFMMYFFLPKVSEFFRIPIVSDEVGSYFTNIIKEQEQYRKENNLVYNDFLDYLFELRNKCKEYDFDYIHMTTHVLQFFSDGFETSASAISYILYELASQPNIQKKLQDDIDEVFEKHGEFTYEGVMHEMKYLDAVVQESLRLHPPIGFIRKRCTKSYTLPPAKEGCKELQLDAGTPIVIPTYSIMRDPQYFKKPNQYDPDRFMDERKAEIVKNTILSFGVGQRQCIGMRFAQMQIKVGVVSIMRNYELRVHSRTKEPLEDDPTGMFLKPRGGIWLSFHKRSNVS